MTWLFLGVFRALCDTWPKSLSHDGCPSVPRLLA